ncbi:MAG: uroporphyrinogen decarboxylase family protein [Candidatus Cloacimonetes bacterium]|nr:uroporphyrinogen decarboxylase family protein [Candidatus Cloacimonadota bacterium]
MNSSERVQTVLKGKWPDKRPIILHNFMMAAREAGYTMKQYRENPQAIANSHIQAAEKYGLDGVLLDIDTALLGSAIGVPTAYPENEPARCNNPLLNSLEEVKNLEQVDISKSERIQISLEAARIIKRHFDDEIFLRGNVDQAPFSLASMVRTPAEWMMDLMMDPDNAFKLLDYCLYPCQQYMKLMAAENVHMLSNGDSPAGPEMVSPEIFRTFVLPYEKKLVDLSHQLNLPYMNHICGDTELILDDMPKTGLDAIELDYKTDIYKIHDKYKNSIVLSGTIDPSGIIAHGTPKDVEEKTVELLKLYEDSPRFIMNAGCAIPTDTPEENIRRMVEITRNYY